MAFDQATADRVCELISEGRSLRSACEIEGAKHSTFLRWCDENQALADQYTRAREVGRALRFEKLREITDSEPERDEKGRIDPGWVAWKRLHVDTEKWSLSKEDAKRYGDKLQTEHSGGVSIITATPTDEAI